MTLGDLDKQGDHCSVQRKKEMNFFKSDFCDHLLVVQQPSWKNDKAPFSGFMMMTKAEWKKATNRHNISHGGALERGRVLISTCAP